ncbi:MAG: PAS domain-containing protein, partial [Ignavibacteria bacterium]
MAAPPADAAPERRANRRARREASIAVDEQSAAGHDIPTAAQLRSRATARLADRPKLVVLPADPDPQKLVHELQVHQTELEMQNEALRESRTLAEAASERLEIALRATGAGLWDWDLEAGTLHLSAHCHEILGLTRHRAQTDPGRLARLVHPDDLPAARHALERRLTADVEGDVEFRMRDAAGSLRWLQCTGRVTSRHPDGAPRRMVGTLTDITERKRAEEQLRIAGVAFRSGEAMIVTDAHGVILQVNPAFTEITGYSAEEAVGHTPALMKSGRHDTDFYRTLWEAVTREG